MPKNLGLVILDRSGSMQSMLEQAVFGVNNHVKSVSKEVDDIVWTLMMFDTESIDYLYTGKKPDSVVELNTKNFVPRSATPLLDAIGKGLTDLDKFIDGLVDGAKPERVSIVIMTDGLENSSQEYSHDLIKSMIKEREDRGWQVIYLGANQDAFAVGSLLGIQTTRTFNKQTTDVAFASSAMASMSYYSTGETDYGHEDVTLTATSKSLDEES